MKIKKIITKRNYCSWRSWHLVYEWEDVLKKELNASFVINLDNKMHEDFSWLYSKLPVAKIWPWSSFVFEMLPTLNNSRHNNNSNIVPCIIDWYLKKDAELHSFCRNYNKHKLILVTSKQVYDYLSTKELPIKFGHFPLSISDIYRISPDTTFEKDIDIVLMGRQNPVLLEWLNRYCDTHPGLIIASSKRQNDNYNYYTQDGQFVANAVTRSQCMDLMQRSRVSLYSTKGMDNDYTDFATNGFSQVTPRLFECMVTGNHIISRYQDNEDTDYYELNSLCPHTDSYESFKRQLTEYLEIPVDMKFYSEYLEKHYTSTRVELLEELITPL